ncbi:enoyl-CoA hydratase/isomerase family protein [Salicibibacter halophilus]|uniref:Enoyl-CoA hydratase/isomerase family protein n=1 Tax=Salicibibacter halophilus TaxID=2502791 RepID=A0A514LJL6_9BACI|nr:enoyl-CoA hydratase/isomerase family protein [Salicibibacter halophilus]QDI92047.1 enoyl-CoA hydratase/isomerase family protein [Salicibibacter halophilus]
MAYETIQVEKKDKGVTWITIDNPPANAIGDQLMEELVNVAEELEKDKDVRVIVLTSAHEKTFLAGADLKGMMQGGGKGESIAEKSGRMQACFDRFAILEKPVVAAINGHALGGGCELALACDFRIMSKGKIGLTETNLGLIPGAGGTQRMTRLLGRAKAIDLIFNARRLEPEEALNIGLINQAVAPESLEAETTVFAEHLAEGAVQAMGLAKRAINNAEGSIEEGLKVEADAFAETLNTGEPSVGIQAFFQKKKPNFIK